MLISVDFLEIHGYATDSRTRVSFEVTINKTTDLIRRISSPPIGGADSSDFL